MLVFDKDQVNGEQLQQQQQQINMGIAFCSIYTQIGMFYGSNNNVSKRLKRYVSDRKSAKGREPMALGRRMDEFARNSCVFFFLNESCVGEKE